ncbi:MAG: hypothetical protein ABSD77_08785 [Verrucomicrobiota bacterium]|jgi:hypothetical protein
MQFKVSDFLAWATLVLGGLIAMKKPKKVIGWFLIIASCAFLLFAVFSSNTEKSEDRNQIATTSGNNSPATIQSATVSGSNNTVVQAAPGATVNASLSDESIKLIQEGMLALQKEKDAELKAKFNLGYILFTATDRNEIIPLGSPMDEILKVDWKSGYNVSFSDSAVTLTLPNMVFQPPNSGGVDFNSPKIGVRRHFEPFARPGFVVGNYRLAFKVVSTNANSIVVAMGIESPPEPRPTMEELMKYNQ